MKSPNFHKKSSKFTLVLREHNILEFYFFSFSGYNEEFYERNRQESIFRSWFKNFLIVYSNEDIFLPAMFPREILYCIYYKNKLNH